MEEGKDNEIRMLPLKPYTLGQLSKLYKTDRDTFREWLKPFKAEIGEKKRNYYDIEQVEVIFRKLDLPDLNDDIKQAA